MPPADALTAVGPVIAALERLQVPYYLGGSIASSAYGVARATLDVDLVASLAQEHVAPLTEMLSPAFYVDSNMISDAVRRHSYFNVIHLATMFKVDVFVVKNRMYDLTALQRIRRDSLDLENPDRQFYLASPEDVVLNKLEWFRLGDEVSERQWRDVIGVLAVQGSSLDREYLHRWAAELGVADLLERACREAEI
ncbi:MAG: hypothetical protein ABFD16_06230 [Thermoguttaceae bacterium]